MDKGGGKLSQCGHFAIRGEIFRGRLLWTASKQNYKKQLLLYLPYYFGVTITSYGDNSTRTVVETLHLTDRDLKIFVSTLV